MITDDNELDEPGFPYLAFCPISVYDPANHKKDTCPYCTEFEITDDEIKRIIEGDWTPSQIASFERAHEKPLGRMEDSEWCTCGGKYNHVDTMQGTHPTEGTWTQDSYQCDKCKTWCIITWDAHGVEYDRRYEADE